MDFKEFNLARVVQLYHLGEEEQKILKTLVVDLNSQESISQEQQRSENWLRARKYRLTASRFGGAAGHNEYCSKKQLLTEMLWNSFQGNIATEYGVQHEQKAEDLYLALMRKHKGLSDQDFYVNHKGLVVSQEFPWLGVSTDGYVYDASDSRKRGGLEIKCPFGKLLYPFIPSQYYDQIQGSANLLDLPFWDFVVFSPAATQIRRFSTDAKYWKQVLFPKLESFYMTEFLPRLVWKMQNRLEQNQIDLNARPRRTPRVQSKEEATPPHQGTVKRKASGPPETEPAIAVKTLFR